MQSNKNDAVDVSLNIENFRNRVIKEFKTCTYIGDIQISEEEYLVLMNLLYDIDKAYFNLEDYVISPILAVALVQIGLRSYDGNYWIHVKEEIPDESIFSLFWGGQNLSGVHQKWLGRSFYYTLEKYGKYRKNESEMVNNILLHCFITDHYANDLFDFLFSYYQIDLDRDLSRNDEQMQDYLLQSIKKGENSVRANKIKKHTSDAVIANENESKKRINRILQFMDDALFNDRYPSDSQDRIAKLFCQWANDSKNFEYNKKNVSERNKKGSKLFTSPYIHFNTNSKSFNLILPSQHIPLLGDEELQKIEWKISLNTDVILDVDFNSGVTCCKTEKRDIEVNKYIFDNIKIELIKNETQCVRKFAIKSDSVRFFDNDWDLINESFYLPTGNAFAFTKPNEILISKSDSVLGCERVSGLDLYTVELKKGDIWRLPNGRAIVVGHPTEEGLFSSNLISDAYIMRDDKKIPIYSSIPSLFFRMKQTQENGTCIYINEKPHRFDIEQCVKTDEQDGTGENGYILQLANFCDIDGIYRVAIDVPNSKKERYYEICIIKGFSYTFDADPYIFKANGVINFSNVVNVVGMDDSKQLSDNRFSFEIQADRDHLLFTVDVDSKLYTVQIDIPVFKWQFGKYPDKEPIYNYDNDSWEITKPEEIWHSEFPEIIYLKYPCDSVEFSMPPINLDNGGNDFTVSFSKNKEHNLFICNTRKMISWFGSEEPLRPLNITFSSNKFLFCPIVTRCYIRNAKSTVREDRENNQLIFECDIGGYSDCEADIYRENTRIKEKIPVKAGGIKLKIPFISGKYRVDFFEVDDEDDFGSTNYRKFDSKIYQYVNKYDLNNSYIDIFNISERNDESIFKENSYSLKSHLIIDNLVNSENNNIYYGKLSLSQSDNVDVLVEFNNQHKMNSINLKFFDTTENVYKEFLYDKRGRCIVADNDIAPNNYRQNNRYIRLANSRYYYNVQIKRHKEGN